MPEPNDTASAISLFEEAATRHAAANERGDYKTGNRAYAQIVKAAAFLKENGALPELLKLLNHTSTGVRIWAAAYTLSINETDAVDTLKDVADGAGIHSFIAKTTLREWEKGNLQL